MKRWLAILTLGLLVISGSVGADVVVGEEEDGDFAPRVAPIRAGQLEITPILSLRVSGSEIYYRGGIAAALAISRYHQIGGSFIAGNRELSLRSRVDIPDELAANQPRPIVGNTLTLDEGFGSSVSGFYRLNLPFSIEKQTYPFLELFGARDFLGWGDVSEAGGSVGVRKTVSRHTAFTTQYGYSVLFHSGQRTGRHFVTAGVSMFFR